MMKILLALHTNCGMIAPVPEPQQPGASHERHFFDPKTLLETYRNAFAPASKAQQDGLKTFERVGRFQYAVAGDYLEWTLAQVAAVTSAQSPSEFVSKQTELAKALGDKLQARTQEFVTLATEAQTSLTQAMKDAAAKITEATQKAA